MSVLTAFLSFSGAWSEVPVDPDAPHAHDLLVRELSNPAYQAAKPNWLDQAAHAVQNWIASLFSAGSGVTNTFTVVGIVVVVCLIIGALILFGVPRLNHTRSGTRIVLEHDDNRTAAGLRHDAAAAARAGRWDAAVIEQFRAIARGLSERTVLLTQPGTTAREIATRGGVAFPDLNEELTAGAAIFDGVRYLGHDGSPADFELLRALDARLTAARPARHHDPLVPGAVG